jgi:hypothetical protein
MRNSRLCSSFRAMLTVCFSRDGPNRILQRVMPGSGFRPYDCAAMCVQASFNTGNTVVYNFLGLEYGGECCKSTSLTSLVFAIFNVMLGCGTSVPSSLQRLPDIACESMACGFDYEWACGGSFIMALYQMPDRRLNPRCQLTSLNHPFQLHATFLDDPTTSMPIVFTILQKHINRPGVISAGIISVRSCLADSLPF